MAISVSQALAGNPPAVASHLFVKDLGGLFTIRDRSRHQQDPYQQRCGFFLTRERAEQELREMTAEVA